MSSSIKPKKFLFNTRDFSEQGMEIERKASLNTPPPPPSFSEAELDDARREGHRNGYNEATREHKESLERKAMQVMEEISRQLQNMITSESFRQARYEHDALKLALVLLEQLYPVLQERLAGDQLIYDAQILLAEARGQDDITMRVHPEMMHALSERFAGIDGVKIISDASLQIHDITLKWPHGGVETLRGDTYKMLQQLVRDTLDGGTQQKQTEIPLDKNLSEEE